MSRKDRLVFQMLMLLAVGTFLFGIWALVGGLKKATAAPAVSTNNVSVSSPAK